jgi:hypothetical protein
LEPWVRCETVANRQRRELKRILLGTLTRQPLMKTQQIKRTLCDIVICKVRELSIAR